MAAHSNPGTARERSARLKAALRSNLAKRKQRDRATDEGPAEKADDPAPE